MDKRSLLDLYLGFEERRYPEGHQDQIHLWEEVLTLLVWEKSNSQWIRSWADHDPGTLAGRLDHDSYV